MNSKKKSPVASEPTVYEVRPLTKAERALAERLAAACGGHTFHDAWRALGLVGTLVQLDHLRRARGPHLKLAESLRALFKGRETLSSSLAIAMAIELVAARDDDDQAGKQ